MGELDVRRDIAEKHRANLRIHRSGIDELPLVASMRANGQLGGRDFVLRPSHFDDGIGRDQRIVVLLAAKMAIRLDGFHGRLVDLVAKGFRLRYEGVMTAASLDYRRVHHVDERLVVAIRGRLLDLGQVLIDIGVIIGTDACRDGEEGKDGGDQILA